MNKILLLTLALMVTVVTGCSPSSQQASNSIDNDPSVISITDFANRIVAFNEPPHNIIALSNGETDIIYALGGHLVGKPTSTGQSTLSGTEDVAQIGSTHEVDLEKITLLKPDVVLGNNPMNTKDVLSIEGIGSKMVLTSANSVDEIKQQITLFGTILQKEEKASELNAAIDEKLSDYVSSSSEEKPRVLIVYGAPGTYMAALSNSLSGNLLEKAGGYNIASDFPALQSYPQYAQMNTERIVQSNPQLILIMTHGNPEEVKKGFLKEMQTNSAWSGIDAVINNKVDILPSELFGSNPGTKVIDALDFLHTLLEDVNQTS